MSEDKIDRRTFLKLAGVTVGSLLVKVGLDKLIHGNGEKAEASVMQLVGEGDGVRVYLRTNKENSEQVGVAWTADFTCMPDGMVRYLVHDMVPDTETTNTETTFVSGDPIENTVAPGAKPSGIARATTYDTSGEVPKPIGADDFDWSLWVEKCGEADKPFKSFLPIVFNNSGSSVENTDKVEK